MSVIWRIPRSRSDSGSRQALAEPNHIIQPFDQDHWAERYDAYDLAAALELFTAMRGWNLLLLKGVGTEDFARPGIAPRARRDDVSHHR